MALTAAEIQHIIRTGLPAAEEIDLRIDQAGAEGVVARYPFRSTMLRPGGTLSGPTMMGLADAAMYAAIMARLGRVEMAVTSNLNINFLSKPGQSDLIAHARVLRLGSRLAFLEVEIYSQGCDDMVAHVSGSYALPSSR
ncbi:MAG: PaaI family thioesterase [Gammaproteobacteria bacterium]